MVLLKRLVVAGVLAVIVNLVLRAIPDLNRYRRLRKM